MRKVCFFHAGCPDGFGAAWAVWQAWGDDARYQPIGHDEVIAAEQHVGDTVAFVDIAPPNPSMRELARAVDRLIVLDHHVSSRDRFTRDPRLAAELEAQGHEIHFDLTRSGAVLAWRHFHRAPVPRLLEYVQDQDLWNWKLPRSEEVNAAIGTYEREFGVWEDLAKRSAEDLASEGAPLVRAARIDVLRAAQTAHSVWIGDEQIEAVNATSNRSAIGHELSSRAVFGKPWGLVYRIRGDRVDGTLYSIGDVDVTEQAVALGGGGHRNAAGFSIPIERWLHEFLRSEA